MIVAIDITTAPAGEVRPDALSLIAALYQPGSPADRLVLLGREEHRRSLVHATHGLATVLTLDAPEPGRGQMGEYRHRKVGLMHDHGAQLLHVAGGGPLDVLAVDGPVVVNVNGVGRPAATAALSSAERWHAQTWWTAATFRADAVVVPTPSVADALHRQFGIDQGKVFVCPASPAAAVDLLTAAYAHATGGQPKRKAA